MGMFDQIICNYPLPGKAPAFIEPDHIFQTKDLDNFMDTYIISEDGLLKKTHNEHMKYEYEDEDEDEDESNTNTANENEDYTGSISFYTSNICAMGSGTYTRNGEDYESVTYKAVFINGKVTSIVESERDIGPAFSSSKMKIDMGIEKTDEDLDKIEEGQDVIGKRLYILWGGTDTGYYANVVAETDKDMCIKSEETEKLEIMSKSYVGHIAWLSKEKAHKIKDGKNNAWKKGLEEYDNLKKEWELKNPDKIKPRVPSV